MRLSYRQTQREKQGALDGVNIFFGALLGANLGTIDTGLSNYDYVVLIAGLAALVMVIRQFSTSERRLSMLLGLLVCSAAVAVLLFLPGGIDGMQGGSRQRLGLTFGVWVALVAMVEFLPTVSDDKSGEDVHRAS